jgi:DNA polymerase-3 subunit gamma/tau
MSYLVLARQHRPQNFQEVIKQEHVTQTLANAIKSSRVAHALLFSGPRGTGKTTVARIFAKSMNCEQGPTPDPCNACRSCREITNGSASDVFEIDGASNNSVDQVRELRENIKYKPVRSQYKIYVIDEVHMLSVAAFNALLKTLEEPPEHVLFVFATTDPHKIPATILSRCQRHDFRRIDLNAIAVYLASICQKEKVQLATDDLWLIARESDGCMRDALSLLDQVLSAAAGDIAHEQVIDILGIVDRKMIDDLSDALLNGAVVDALGILDHANLHGVDLKKLYFELVEHFRNLLIIKMGRKIHQLVELPSYELDHLQKKVVPFSMLQLQQLFELLYKEETTVKYATHPKLALEMIFIKLNHVRPALPIEQLIESVDRLRAECSHALSADDASVTKTNDLLASSELVAPPKRVGQPKGLKDASTENALLNVSHSQDVLSQWKAVLDEAQKEFPHLAAYLKDSHLRSRTKWRLEIVVPGNSYAIKQLQRNKNLVALKKICRQYFGEEQHIKIIADSNNPKNIKQAHDEQQKLKQQAINHPLVAEAIDIFNGEISDIKLL